MLTEKQLKQAMQEHFDAERARDVDWVVATVSDDVEYNVVGPHYPDDPVRAKPAAEGREAVRQLWIKYYSKFANYHIVCGEEDMLAFPDRNIVWAQVRITATPVEDFEGFPAGKPFSYRTAALCHFNDDGKLTSETVYGSLGQVLMDFARMREFLAESGGRKS